MAGSGEKKRQKLLAEFKKYLYIVIIAVNVIYLIFRVGLYRSSFTSGRQYAYYTIVFLTILFSYLLLSARSNARMLDFQGDAQPGSRYIDLLGLTFTVQLGSLYSDYFWLLFLIIPGTLIYYGIRMLLNWVFTPQESDFIDANGNDIRLQNTASGKGRASNRKSGNKYARFRN
jgi:hypothetical protein